MSTPDPLFEVKNSFYIGDYQACINASQKVKLANASDSVIRDLFFNRAYIAQSKYRIPLGEIKRGAPDALQSCLLLAKYLNAAPDSSERSKVVEQLETKLAAGVDPDSKVDSTALVLVAAAIYMAENGFDRALKVLAGVEDLECLSYTLNCYLAMNRVDLARATLKQMQELDDDSTLTQLAEGSIHLAAGGNDGIQTAVHIYQDLIDKYQTSVMLLNNLACALALQERLDEAESRLQDALAKDNNDADTLLNLSVIAARQGKRDVAARLLRQLRDAHPNYRRCRELSAKEREFDEIAARLTV